MTSALLCNGSRVLTPDEATLIRSVIQKPSSRALFDLLLYTGLRFAEARQLADNPVIFDEGRGTLSIRSQKVKAKQNGRNVILGDKGIAAVREFLKLGGKVPATTSTFQNNLIAWCKAAGITSLATPPATGNQYGITVRTTRKTWESWLLAACPEQIVRITLSQGHSETVALHHYLNVSFTTEERQAIVQEVIGWCR